MAHPNSGSPCPLPTQGCPSKPRPSRAGSPLLLPLSGGPGPRSSRCRRSSSTRWCSTCRCCTSPASTPVRPGRHCSRRRLHYSPWGRRRQPASIFLAGPNFPPLSWTPGGSLSDALREIAYSDVSGGLARRFFAEADGQGGLLGCQAIHSLLATNGLCRALEKRATGVGYWMLACRVGRLPSLVPPFWSFATSSLGIRNKLSRLLFLVTSKRIPTFSLGGSVFFLGGIRNASQTAFPMHPVAFTICVFLTVPG